jgi:hypothetical protein
MEGSEVQVTTEWDMVMSVVGDQRKRVAFGEMWKRFIGSLDDLSQRK